MQPVLILAHLDHASRLTDLLESQPALSALWAGIAIALGMGALHALAPGHGKTMTSAYLVGAHRTAAIGRECSCHYMCWNRTHCGFNYLKQSSLFDVAIFFGYDSTLCE